MKNWLVRIPMYCEALVEVSAETEAQAIETGQDDAYTSLCHHCSKNFELGEPDMSGDITAEETE